MSKLWCGVLILALSGSVLARTPDGADDEKKSSDNRTKSLAELTAELEAQKAELDAQRAEIQALQSKTGAMSLEGTGAIPDPQNQPKPALPEDVKSKWAMNIYGFVEADFIELSKQTGATDTPGNPVIPAGHGTWPTEHNQLTFGARNSRIGFNGSAPEYAGFRASVKLEMDFEGVAGGTSNNGNTPNNNSEGNATWVNPTFRIRHMYLVLDSDYITFQIGQGWELIGWQPYFMPDTVDIQGVAGELYSRSTKFQASHVFRGPLDIEVAGAAVRPPERASNAPDLQAGIKFSIPEWVGVHSIGAAGGSIDPAAIGFSGCFRSFRFQRPETAATPFFTGLPSDSVSARGEAVAVDLFLPIFHLEKESKANSLSINAETLYGKGINDLYTGFTGGAAQTATNGLPQITDAGYVGWNHQNLDAVQWRTTLVGIQYWLPGDGSWWIAANYSACQSNNMSKLGVAPFANGTSITSANSFAGANGTTAFKASQWLNVNLFWDITPAVRFGASLDQFRNSYAGADNATSAILFDGTPTSRQNHMTMFQFSAFYIF
jgi:hypothetical protein